MSNSYVRISTEAADHIFEVETFSEARDAFARQAGCRDYAELARTLGQTVDEAEADLIINYVSAADVVRGIADEALASDPADDGADRFATSEDWADWCIKGQDGDAVRSLAELHGLDAAPLVKALRDILSERDLAAINAGFAA
ncbi:hypothetical protein [Methylobacterium sp. ARG-1]|uniref:hypothetical protein n=1 Tax=Methylobacterium sp. ARG-1 TaxID=1692501 RepID=UPI00068075AA|nr:hypothetical protein [Methylobacterium sp. ARG-1]KNY22653.1 hypothetical protein AKJ13_10340 [Methylobacterium sp. ARG-1]